MLVGKIIEKLRKKQLLSQEDLAYFSQKDRRTISDLETNQYGPTLLTIFKLAAALEIKPSELVKEIEEVDENARYYNQFLAEVKETKSVHKKSKNSN
ncbi:helix-turn-helix domain-containing protein [Mesobacillus subterraneus]|uniref:Helix-turn-helix domain-containing protein n=1 Tax=Mesobacillus subterraneus TaxID=285983 RepID=A0A427TWM9_9BACI|nr:helix-turn-helix domain-containing protein [Mesobacillus subterraneus]